MKSNLTVLLAATFLLAACASAEPTFRVAVIVDMTTDPVSQEQAQAVLAEADAKLRSLTGFGMQLVDFVEEGSGRSIEGLALGYMSAHLADPPDGILIFSAGDDDRAKINRGYAQQIPVSGLQNRFVSPFMGSEHIYVAVLQFGHRYAACGYGSADSIQSPFSIGDECRGEVGSVCAEWQGMQVCEIALEFLEGHTPIDMAAGVVVHEFMHPFGNRGLEDHFSSAGCNAAMGREADYYSFEESERYNDMCPDVYETFANSYRSK